MRHVPLFCAVFLFLFAAPVAASPHPGLPDGTVPNCLGINIHFTQALPGELEMLAATGARWVRMDLGWGRTEKVRGVYDFSAHDKLLDDLDLHKLRAVLIFDYGNKLYSPVSPATPVSRAAYTRWVVAAVKHFRGRGVLWEMWNEPNLFWTPKPSAEAYSELALQAGRAFKKAAPKEVLIGPAIARLDLTLLEQYFRGGLLRYFDAVSVHPYRNTAPDSVAPEYVKIRALIEQYKPRGKTLPILSGEWGYSSAEGRLSETQQARYLARQWLVNLSENVPLSIWYDWRDDGDNPQESEHRYGLVRRPHFAARTPAFDAKPAYLAAQNLIRQLHGFRFERRLDTGSPDDWVLVFRRGQQRKIAAWTAPVQGRSVKITGAKSAMSHDLLGEIGPQLKAANEEIALPLSPSVAYFDLSVSMTLAVVR